MSSSKLILHLGTLEFAKTTRCLYLCVCVCVYVCVYLCACVCVCMCVYLCACVCICVHVCVCVYVMRTVSLAKAIWLGIKSCIGGRPGLQVSE